MALSLLARGFATKLNGCSSRILSQNAIRLSSSALQNASTFRLARPILATNIYDKFPQQHKLIKMEYSTVAPKAAEGSHVSLWVAERVLSVALIAVVPLAIACPSKPLDVLLAVSLVAHTYWGFEAVIQDYVRTLIFGSVVPKLVHGVLILAMMLTLGGLFYLIFDDIGFAGTIRKLWGIKSKE